MKTDTHITIKDCAFLIQTTTLVEESTLCTSISHDFSNIVVAITVIFLLRYSRLFSILEALLAVFFYFFFFLKKLLLDYWSTPAIV